ncbi:MAG: RNA polymerase sigma factor [Blastocatellales bacterium]
MTNQPEIAAAYMDEWGVVAPEVYQAAMALREQAGSYARATLHNEDAGYTLLAKASAIVTRALDDHPGHITNLSAYLFKTYKRQVLAELEKEKSHERILTENTDEIFPAGHNDTARLDRYILVQELRKRMNQRTRLVLDLLTLGHSFEEIGLMLGKSSRAMRNNYYEQVARLKKELRDELTGKSPR